MTAQQQINNFKSLHPHQTRGLYLSKAQVLLLLHLNPDVDGIRLYLGQDENDKFQGYANACIGLDDYFQEGFTKSYQRALPCPTYCSKV